ncbi:MAG: hypothetical protein AMXMBFR34_43370 [Myxococcaceae bacterium]
MAPEVARRAAGQAEASRAVEQAVVAEQAAEWVAAEWVAAEWVAAVPEVARVVDLVGTEAC